MPVMPAWPLRPVRKPSNCFRALSFSTDGVADVRAVEAGEEDECFAEAEAEADENFVARRLVGGGGERDARHVGIAFVQCRELQVFRPEIMASVRSSSRRSGAI